MSFVAARRRPYRQQYRPRLGLGPLDLGAGSGASASSGSSITSIIGSIGKVASGLLSSTSGAAAPAKGVTPAAATGLGPLAGVSTGTIVGIAMGFSALILALASRGGR